MVLYLQRTCGERPSLSILSQRQLNTDRKQTFPAGFSRTLTLALRDFPSPGSVLERDCELLWKQTDSNRGAPPTFWVKQQCAALLLEHGGLRGKLTRTKSLQ